MIGIGLISVEAKNTDYYKNCTLNSIEYWSKNYQVNVLTNTPDFFLYKNCKVFTYPTDKFNFHDKMTFLGMLSNEYEVSMLVDTNKIPMRDIVELNENDFEPGLHSPDFWNENWETLNKFPLVNDEYSYWMHWDDQLGISKMKEVPLPICEKILLLKRHPQFTQYLELIEEKYKKVATENDRFMCIVDPKSNDSAEGRAEGFSFSLAAAEIGFPLFCPSYPIYALRNELKREYL